MQIRSPEWFSKTAASVDAASRVELLSSTAFSELRDAIRHTLLSDEFALAEQWAQQLLLSHGDSATVGRETGSLWCEVCIHVSRPQQAKGVSEFLLRADLQDEPHWWALRTRASLAVLSAAYLDAMIDAEACLTLARILNRKDLQVRSHALHALLHVRQIASAKAIEHAQQAVELADDLEPQFQDIAWWYLGNAWQHAGNSPNARDAYRKSRAAANLTGSRLAVSHAEFQLAVVLRQMDSLTEAHETFMRVADYRSRVADVAGLAPIWCNLGHIERTRGEPAKAIVWYDRAAEQYAILGKQHHEHDLRFYGAVARYEAGQHKPALQQLQALVPFYRDVRQGKELDLVYEAMALCFEAAGDFHRAREHELLVQDMRAGNPEVSSEPSRRLQPRRRV